jgi:metal-dependent amidase/aminoacylase/carboxypeptidase family protein
MRVPVLSPPPPPVQASPTITGSKPSIPELLRKYPINQKKYEQFRAYLHSHPELSTLEKNTAAFVVVQLTLMRVYEVHERIGGTGVAAVFHNGPGMTVLLRADMDGLPVQEQTGLPYASKVYMRDTDGAIKPVM